MKINLNSDELDDLEGMSDADLAALIRASLKKFRGKKAGAEAEDDIPGSDPSAAGHGGASRATLETTASQRAGAIQATQDSARRLHEAQLAQADRDAEAEKLIPGYRRL